MTNIYDRANALRALGYRVLAFRDDDKQPPAATEAGFLAGGGELAKWSAGRALEDELFASLPDKAVVALLRRAAEIHGKDLVMQHVASALGRALRDREPGCMVDVPGRHALAKAAKCRACELASRVSRAVAAGAATLRQQWARELFTAFCDWDGLRRERADMPKHIGAYARFFAVIDAACSDAAEVPQARLVDLHGAEGLRRGFQAVAFLAEHLALAWIPTASRPPTRAGGLPTSWRRPTAPLGQQTWRHTGSTWRPGGPSPPPPRGCTSRPPPRCSGPRASAPPRNSHNATSRVTYGIHRGAGPTCCASCRGWPRGRGRASSPAPTGGRPRASARGRR